ncbi:4-hydroxy-tetrahydrodipicolinate synthase [Candidatus Fermentibacterales bacterium]|nr:4-hydroxy-tetrahydrodipicolinate synthase [Candidatus Fermentibacterales bacterium]
MFRGAITALVTPFRNGRVDTAALSSLAEWQIEKGIDGLLACGCTGEAAALTHEEHLHVVRTVLDAADGRVPVLAGTGKNDTRSTVELSAEVSAMGVDGVLVITPYYNKPVAEGQIAHYRAVADAVECPLIVYNVPGRTGTNMTPETIAELAGHPRIAGIKDAAGSAERVTAMLCLGLPEDFAILSGDDALAMAQVALGAKGVISVVSNIAPAAVAELVALTETGSLAAARKLQGRLYPLIRAMFLETNPIPVKCALSLMGMIENEPRLPLTPLSDSCLPALRAAMEGADLL